MSTKDKIIQTSIKLFNEHGERAITTNHISSHMGISPGNLYYHFKNKEDIIRHIFSLYSEHLHTQFLPIVKGDEALSHLSGYLDALFELMWRFHFFYDNLGDILSRDEVLKKDYIDFQAALLGQVREIIIGLREGGVITIDDEDAVELAHMLKITVSFWTPYIKARRLSGELMQQDIYNGILKILLLVKAYGTEQSIPKINLLREKYSELAQEAEPA
ncbi:TetR family transcriptional regulator [Pseudoalteromonas porphyrae]|uniref:TetR family transcriptional regulator n=2 Tax=Pseudoalteromonas TaxID=53246 RepID=A0A0N1EJJ9_9GAMM|nr:MULTISPECIES: TetR/AcrR family transcriptional regulator [Pseudoalteromonas]KPH61397.1 TetR family transcriptional regulator [Pseudoalteromonas porphyrae]KPH95465.1 TetR family transcriptional regulator [Pseudoalteromonas porphyrae]NMR24466.1 TetR/AcrR family transcriptional regulator [Pseudoalteromonas sp. NEC-BIFX-2020_015]NNG42117.1 TetR/AcrR family transcriptional regulator [Pseudoalteromonas sp. NEC-BIFX-2020_002]